MRWWRRGLLLLVGLVLVIAVGFVTWALWIPAPQSEAIAALATDDAVQVRTEPWLTFTPITPTTRGLILYPGARVDPRAYAPAARAVAAQGFIVVIPAMPLNLAFFAPDRADAVKSAYPAVTQWAIGGHSLGGAMAANYVYTNPQVVPTLILWAAYPAESNSLAARTDLHVTSIYGTLDGLATLAKIEESRAWLPPTTTWAAIEGGNHAQFGWYGPQRGDNPATISHEQQQAQIVYATVAALNAQ